jgi:predicted DCC family thiol-disulfide oxidoreductase YuxK/O-antigen ligase
VIAPTPAGTADDGRGPEPLSPSGAAVSGRLRRLAGWLYSLHLLTIFGLAVSNAFLWLTLLVAPPALRFASIPWPRLKPLYRPLGFYVLALGASVVASYEPRVSAGSLTELLSLATVFLGPLLVRGERHLRRLTEALVIVGALIAVYGLAQLLYGYGGLDRRIRGPFSHWMTYAGVLLVCDLLLVARLAVDRTSRRAWNWAALALINLGLLGSLTRGAWVALAVTLLVLPTLRRPRYLAAVLPAVVLFVLLAPVPLLNRVASIVDLRDESNYDRLCMADAGLRMIAERPLFGIGPDMVQRRYALYRNPDAPRYWVPHLHNTLLQLTAERGLASLAAYLWLMAAPIALSVRRYRAQGGARGPRADLYLGTVLAIVGFNVAGLFEYNWGDTEVQRLALFLLALPFCLEAEEKPAAESAGSRMAGPAHPILLFDGVCNLCNGSVQLIIRRDPEARFRFASLQSAVGQRYLGELGVDRQAVDSVILIEGDRWYKESDAALRIARLLGGPWRALAIFRLLPRPLRDGLYRVIARHRYRWFGKRESCWLPTPELRSRFLDLAE